MRCAECGAPSRFLLTEGGVQIALCGRCANVQSGIAALDAYADSFRRPRKGCEVCPHCGTTREQITRTGLVGCPLCYEAFSEELWEKFGIKSNT